MPNTDSFLCRFAHEGDEDGQEFYAHNHSSAAKKFAAGAQDDHMWEHSNNEWTGDYSVVVKHLYTGTVKLFNITREYEPVFSATEVRE